MFFFASFVGKNFHSKKNCASENGQLVGLAEGMKPLGPYLHYVPGGRPFAFALFAGEVLG